MSEFIAWLVGLAVGFLWGAYMMFIHMKDKTTIHNHITMDAEQAARYIESDEVVKQLKKELDL